MTKKPTYQELERRIKDLEKDLQRREQGGKGPPPEFEKKFETIIRNMGIGFAIISKDYRTLWANDVLKKIFGDVVGEICHISYNQREEICPGCGVRQVFETGEESVTHEQVGKDAHGNIIWSQIVAAPIRDEEGNITSALEAVVPITERKRTEEMLIEYQKAIEGSKDLIAVVDRQYTYRMVNRAFLKQHQLTRDQVVGHKFEEVLGKKVFEETVKPNMDRCLKGQHVRYETQFAYPKIGLRCLEVNYFPQIDRDGSTTRIVSVIRDITEQKKAERERDRLFSLSIDMLCVADFDGYFRHVNPAWSKVLDWSEEELLSKPRLEFVHPDDHDRTLSALRRLMAGEIVLSFDNRYQCKDGSYRWISWNSYPLPEEKLIFAVARDITEKKQAEETLRQSEEMYRLLLKIADVAIFIVQDGVIKLPNQKTEEMTGYSTKELATIPFTNLIHAEDRKEAIERQERWLAGEDFLSPCQYRVIKKTGEEIWIQINDVLINWEGRPGTLNFVRDITHHKRLVDQLERAERMESLGTLAGGIAHDFNNILSPIMVHSEIAMMELSPDHPIQYNLSQIFSASERARDMVKQILSFSRYKQHEKMPIKMGTILKEAVKLLRSSIPTTIQILCDVEAGVDTVLADPTQIHQVIINLCTNAYHAMREKGGVLEVKLEELYLDSQAASRFMNLNAGSYLRLTVRDTGSGIRPEIIKRIFDPYFTTKGAGEGTGMGLAVVHGIVQGHEGDISVESDPGKGTTFRLLFPIVAAEMLENADMKVELLRGTERILLVDDESAAVDAIKPMLERLGYRVTSSTNSVKALESFRSNPAEFDMVITDMTMPNMTGKDLAKELLSIRSDIPIILCTGFSEHISEKRAKGLGIRGFIMKPIVIKELSLMIRDILDEKE